MLATCWQSLELNNPFLSSDAMNPRAKSVSSRSPTSFARSRATPRSHPEPTCVRRGYRPTASNQSSGCPPHDVPSETGSAAETASDAPLRGDTGVVTDPVLTDRGAIKNGAFVSSEPGSPPSDSGPPESSSSADAPSEGSARPASNPNPIIGWQNATSRLVGLETEYAIRYAGVGQRPRHDHIYQAIIAALRREVRVYRGERILVNQQVFVENGGAFYYEFQPTHVSDGLIEGSTPECRSPVQLLIYQRAQEELLKRALLRSRSRLLRMGHDGFVGLLKNARDAEGHGYGTHENYEVDAATGWRLAGLRVGLVLSLPIVLLANVLAWVGTLVFVILVLVGLLGWGLLALIVPPMRPGFARWLDFEARDAPIEGVFGLLSLRSFQVLQLPVDVSFGSVYQHFFFVPQRRALMAHLASRILYTGSGCLMDDGTMWLSERATTLTGIQRWVGAGTAHVVYDSGNLMKGLWAPQLLRFAPLFGLFRRRQRMQIAVGDSNRCQLAEYLKVGTTLLLFDMIDAGWLRDAPRLLRPLESFRCMARDPKAVVATRNHGEMTALSLQRWYLNEARRFVAQANPVRLEARQLVELWAGVLDQYERDPAGLLGRVDWVTKRYLIEASGVQDGEARKKIDLRYGELGTGYFDLLADRGLTLELVDNEQVDRAMREPPEYSPARLRAEILADLADRSQKVYVAWDRIRVGSWIGGQVIRLDDIDRPN